MTLKQIEYYEAVCQTGSVTAAAQQLYVSRSVVSCALQELEEELELQLFLRGRNGMELTEQGKILRNLFSQFQGFYSSLQKQISNLKEQGGNYSLTVGLAISCWSNFSLELYEEFKQRYPQIKLTVLELSSYDALTKLNDGSVDVVITPLNLERRAATLASVDIYPTGTVFCVSPDSPLARQDSVTYQDIKDLPIAVLNSKFPLDWPLQIRLRTNTRTLIRQAVVRGALCAILPWEQVRDWDDVAVLSFNPPKVNMVRALWNKALPHSSALENFLDFLQRYFEGYDTYPSAQSSQ